MEFVSLFPNVSDPENPQYIEFIEYLEMIRDGVWQDIVLSLRNLDTEEEKKKLKEKMQTTCMSGKFKRRSNDSIEYHNSYIAMDLDDLGDRVEKIKSKFVKDKYVKSCFVSAGGYGLRPIFKIESEKHNEAHRALCKYIFEEYGEVCDPNGGVSKPYIVSYDPACYINYHEVPTFKKYIKDIPPKKLPDFIDNSGDFEEIVQRVIKTRTNICEEYSDWLKVGFAISEKFGENGRGYFHEISSLSSKYVYARCDKQYNYFLRSKGGNKINIASFYYICKRSGIAIVSEKTKEIVRTVRNGKAAGLKVEQIIENLEKYNEITGVDAMVKEVFDKSDVDSEKDSILERLEIFIKNNYNIKFNEVTGFLENDDEPMEEKDINSIFISAKKQFEKLDYPLMMRLLKSDFISLYNPFMKFFDSDGKPAHLPVIPKSIEDTEHIPSPLIDKLCDSIVNNHKAYTNFFVKKWLVSIVSACHKVHSPLLLALIGPQYSGKTEFFRNLLPHELRKYYGESNLEREKDDELLMTQKILICIDEFGGKGKRDDEKLKNLTSKQTFSIRRPYGTHNEDILRIAVLCATSNKPGIMSDSTGNRRIIPIDVDKINFELYNSIDKKELFKEAYTLYRKGFDWRVTPIDIPFLNERKDEYKKVDTIREMIEMFYTLPTEENWRQHEKLTVTEIKLDLEDCTGRPIIGNIGGFADVLFELGYERRSVRMEDKTTSKRFTVVKAGRNGNKKKEFGSPDKNIEF